jgi:endonuclease YncB( thermonuclease family)
MIGVVPALLLMLLVAQGAPAAVESLKTTRGKVVRVADGDTVTVQTDPVPGRELGRTIKVRLYGIDAPEHDQPFGEAAARALSELVLGREVEVAKVTRDRYGRMVALVRVNGLDASAVMVRAGYAWAFRRYLGALENDEAYCELEYQARAAALGLWALPHPRRTAPWVYRHEGAGRKRIDRERSVQECIASFEGR